MKSELEKFVVLKKKKKSLGFTEERESSKNTVGFGGDSEIHFEQISDTFYKHVFVYIP